MLLAQTVHLEAGHPTVMLVNPVQVLHSYRDFSEKIVWVYSGVECLLHGAKCVIFFL